jgi:hypothetical protein
MWSPEWSRPQDCSFWVPATIDLGDENTETAASAAEESLPFPHVYREVEGVTDYSRWCPAWSLRRDAPPGSRRARAPPRPSPSPRCHRAGRASTAGWPLARRPPPRPTAMSAPSAPSAAVHRRSCRRHRDLPRTARPTTMPRHPGGCPPAAGPDARKNPPAPPTDPSPSTPPCDQGLPQRDGVPCRAHRDSPPPSEGTSAIPGIGVEVRSQPMQTLLRPHMQIVRPTATC